MIGALDWDEPAQGFNLIILITGANKNDMYVFTPEKKTPPNIAIDSVVDTLDRYLSC